MGLCKEIQAAMTVSTASDTCCIPNSSKSRRQTMTHRSVHTVFTPEGFVTRSSKVEWYPFAAADTVPLHPGCASPIRAIGQDIDNSNRIKTQTRCVDNSCAATRHSWQPYICRDFLSYLTLYGGGPSLSISGLAPLYCPGVGVRGRARFACISKWFL